MSEIKLLILKDSIAEHLDEIGKLFTDKVHLTLVVRNIEHEHGNLFMTDDPTAEQIVNLEFRKTCNTEL